MKKHLQKIVADFKEKIDAMTIDELEEFFTNSGFEVTRKPEHECFHQFEPFIFETIENISDLTFVNFKGDILSNLHILHNELKYKEIAQAHSTKKQFNCDNDYQFEIAA